MEAVSADKAPLRLAALDRITSPRYVPYRTGERNILWHLMIVEVHVRTATCVMSPPATMSRLRDGRGITRVQIVDAEPRDRAQR